MRRNLNNGVKEVRKIIENFDIVDMKCKCCNTISKFKLEKNSKSITCPNCKSVFPIVIFEKD